MITVISGTNRHDSNTLKITEHYRRVLLEKSLKQVQIIDLADIQRTILHPEMYNAEKMNDSLLKIQEDIIIPTEKFVFVSPEYNGSFPGVLKLFIDAISIRKYRDNFVGKKALLVGVATGRAGNLRGMDHLTGVLNHVGVSVCPNKLPLSLVGKILTEDGTIDDEGTLGAIDKQIDQFLAF